MNANSYQKNIGRERIYSRDFEERTDVILWDVIDIQNEQLLKITFISKNSTYNQGLRLAVDVGDGFLECNGHSSKSMRFWEEISPSEFIVKCLSPEGLLSVYNIWNERSVGPGNSQMYCSGMIAQQEGDRTTYYCHDVGKRDISFDKIVFSIEKL